MIHHHEQLPRLCHCWTSGSFLIILIELKFIINPLPSYKANLFVFINLFDSHPRVTVITHCVCSVGATMLNICHNTERTTSPYKGYISSPDYPSPPVSKIVSDATEQRWCSCEISTHTDNTQVELQLIDLMATDQVGCSLSFSVIQNFK